MMNVPEELVCAYFDDELSEQQAEEFSLWIEANSDHAECFVDRVKIHHSLRILLTEEAWRQLVVEESGGQLSFSEAVPQVSRKSRGAWPNRVRKLVATIANAVVLAMINVGRLALRLSDRIMHGARRRFAYVIAVAVVGCLTVIGWDALHQQEPAPKIAEITQPEAPIASSAIPETLADVARPIETIDSPVAEIRRSVGTNGQAIASSGQGPKSFAVGERWNLQEGMVEIVFSSGVSAILKAPLEVAFMSDRSLHLQEGDMSATVPFGVKGFHVDTPTASVIDIGTVFEVNVAADGSTEAIVDEGEVLLSSSQDKAKEGHRVNAGFTGQVDGEGQLVDELVVNNPRRVGLRQAFNIEHAASQRWMKYLQQVKKIPGILQLNTFYDRRSDRNWRDPVKASGRFGGDSSLRFGEIGRHVYGEVDKPLNQLTLAAWVRIEKSPSPTHGFLFGSVGPPIVGKAYWNITSDRSLQFDLCTISVEQVSEHVKSKIGAVRQNSWCHVVTSYDRESAIVRHYVDGQLVGKGQLQIDRPISLGTCSIGQRVGVGRDELHPFPGDVDEVFVFQRILRPEEVTNLYQLGKVADAKSQKDPPKVPAAVNKRPQSDKAELSPLHVGRVADENLP